MSRVHIRVSAQQLAHIYGYRDGAYRALGVVILQLLPQHQLGGVVHLHKDVRIGGDILPLHAAVGAHKPLKGASAALPALRQGAVGVVDRDVAYGLAIKVVEHHAEQVHLKPGADKQLLHTLRWNGLARVAEIHELLRLGGGDVVFGQAVNIALVLLDKYAHVVEGQQAAGVLLLHYIAQAAP